MDTSTLLIKALDFSSKLVRTQFRKDGTTPQIYHPIGVANILSTMAGVTDACIIAAALLIDIGEDPDISFEKIEKDFGSRIRKIVHEMSEDKNSWRDKATVKRPNVIYTYTTTSGDVKLIKLADRLYCLNEIQRAQPLGWDNIRVQAYFEWIKQTLDAGLRGVNSTIEREIDSILVKRGIVLDGKKIISGH